MRHSESYVALNCLKYWAVTFGIGGGGGGGVEFMSCTG